MESLARLGELISSGQRLGSDLLDTSSSSLVQRSSLSCTPGHYSLTLTRSDPNLPTSAPDRWHTPGSICHLVPLRLYLARSETPSCGSQFQRRYSSALLRYPSPFECHSSRTTEHVWSSIRRPEHCHYLARLLSDIPLVSS
jgi:hypothetical protein